MSSGTPRLSRPGSPSYRRWARAGLTATGHGLGFCVLAAAGAGLLLALAAPLFLLLFISERSGQSSRSVAAVPQNASAAASAARGVITSQGAPGPGPGPSPGQHLILAAVALLVLMAVWLFLLPRLVLAIRLLARVTRRLVAVWLLGSTRLKPVTTLSRCRGGRDGFPEVDDPTAAITTTLLRYRYCVEAAGPESRVLRSKDRMVH